MSLTQYGFVDTTTEMPYLDDAFDFAAECTDVEKEGFVLWPEYVPLPLPGYAYRIPGMMEPYSKPACKIRHRIRYWLRHQWDAIMYPVRQMAAFENVFGKAIPEDGIPF